MSDDPRFVRSPHTLQRRTLDSFVLLGAEADEPVIVAGTGADVWTLLTEARTVADLVEILSGHYEGDGDVMTRDVAELLERFVAGGVALRIPG
jgi:hypothetical protein